MATNRINDYIKKGNFFSFVEEKINALEGLEFHEHVEPRVRKDDLTEALSMKVYDPLWMLSRQWLMGEFRGNNAGTAISLRCEVIQEDCSDDPIEPVTEQVNPNIDLMVRVESAMHYLDLLAAKEGKLVNSATLAKLRENFGIVWNDSEKHILECDATKQAEDNLNTQRISFVKAFQNKAFDGYKLYLELKKRQYEIDPTARAYVNWFNKQYLPAGNDGSSNSHWQEQSLNYTIDMYAGSHHFIGDRYQGGRLSWYTVDDADSTNNISSSKKETISSLPTLAHYPGAPNKRLWQFEDHCVFMGNSHDQQTKSNEIFLKFATLYSNDWMLIPLKTALGKNITISSIQVRDTFGNVHYIDCRAGERDKEGDWQMFTNTKYRTNGKVENRFLFVPQLAATLEGKPIEEVELLRDEMANMVWGVEKTVSDGCGFTLDEQLKAVQLKAFIDDLYEQNKKKLEPGMVSFSENNNPERKNTAKCDYRYTLQTHVPFNWIPFVPQHLKNDKDKPLFGKQFDFWGREMILRRGKMPCHILTEEGYKLQPVLPTTSILRKGLGGKEYEPLFINEEEVQQTGIRLIKNYQRARWLNGKTYLWLGMYKRLAKFSENSGLEFDTLHEK